MSTYISLSSQDLNTLVAVSYLADVEFTVPPTGTSAEAFPFNVGTVKAFAHKDGVIFEQADFDAIVASIPLATQQAMTEAGTVPRVRQAHLEAVYGYPTRD